MPDLVNYLLREGGGQQGMHVSACEGKEKRGGGAFTFSLLGTWDRALGSREVRIFWMMVLVAATPQTVPMERKR